ncbi:hypothetical protein F503_04901 [Ophiostoma piceae UAMH 11346]|uniref:DJ-1/PfpI domain-containing protein n=1 Tax=Ophiostoma piceae (strain UAMH 11346) TaxID=1262450 RepID=S3CCJ8_OPHP1|nr:hypothetical protein F503_04901 [Ophiostoma piceae UAMH 11346]
MAQHIVKIGVYIPGDAQLLDVACVDVLGMMSSDYMTAAGLPEQLVAVAPMVNIVYITTVETMAKKAVQLTSSMTMVPTHDILHPDVQPGKLDVVVIPGPAPDLVLASDDREFLRRHAEEPATDILSICTGIYVCGQAGILAGKKACGPRDLQGDIAAKFPGVTLLGDTQRWAHDGNLWSSGGITNGNDMVAAYARASKHFPPPVVELACSIADVGERGQMYDS